MKTIISVTRMSEGDAITLNDGVQAAVADCVREVGAEAVTLPVTGAASELAEATKPLHSEDDARFSLKRDLNTALYRCLGAIFETCDHRAFALDQPVIPLEPDEEAELEAARQLMDVLFPDGKSPLLSRWPIRYGLAAKILSLAKEDAMQAHIACLSLTSLFSLLDRIHKRYGEKMGYTTVVPSEDSGALAKWHLALERYLAAVILSHQSNRDLGARLTAPYDDLAEEVRKSRKRGSSKTSTDDSEPPETGVPTGIGSK